MGLPRFNYSGSWENPGDFPTHEYSENQVRKDIMRLFTEIATYLNNILLPLLEAQGYGGGSGSGSGGGEGGPYLPLAGGQMTGPLLLHADPTANTQAATKYYVDHKSSLIVEGLEDAISALQVDLNGIHAIVSDGLGNVTQIDVTPGKIEMTLQDDLQRLLELLLSAESMKLHFQDGLANSGIDMSAEDFRLWFEGVAGKIAELLMNDSMIQAHVADEAEGLSTTVTITPEGLSSEVEDLFNRVKSLLEQNADIITAAVTQTLEDGSVVGTNFTLTPEQIAAIAEGVNGRIGSVNVSSDQVTATVKDGLTREAVLELISQQISAIVKNEANEAALTITPEQIAAMVRDAVTGDETTISVLNGMILAQIMRQDGTGSELSLTDDELRALVVGPNGNVSSVGLTEGGIVQKVANNTGAIATLNTTAEQIDARVTGVQGTVSALSVRADGIDATVEAQGRNISSIQQRADSISTTVESLETDVNGLSTQYTRIEQTVGGITLETSRDGVDALITLSVPWKEAVTGRIRMEGNVDVSGQLSAEALYAKQGEVSNLAVDYFSTDRRIPKYLRGDSSDADFLRARNQTIELVTGHCLGTTEQARTPDGLPLYWEQDISTRTLTADGYPVVEGIRIYTTTTQTAYPVMVYAYTEEVKASFSFKPYGTNNIQTPVITLGAGNSSGWNKAYLVKGTDGLDIKYISNNNGREVGIRMTTDGYVDITGLRRTTGLNFSGWNSGSFAETVEGRSASIGYAVSFDAQGRPTAITDSASGFTCSVQW